MTALSARFIAKAFGGAAIGNTALIPGPGHSKKDRSLAVTISETDPDGFMVYSHAGDDFRTCRDHVRAGLGLPAFSSEATGKDQPPARSRPVLVEVSEADDTWRIERALALWGEAVSPVGSPVDTYLASRALTLPESVIRADSIRFHPACPYRVGEEIKRLPTMVSLMRDIRTGEPMAVHRTALRGDGRGKYDAPGFGSAKKMLGRVKGSAVMLSAFEDVTHGLNISEGIENGLTALSCMDAAPMWALGSAGAMRDFPALSGVEYLTIWADPEETGIDAADTCAARWKAAGAEGTAKVPRGKDDWNALHCALSMKGAA